MWDNFSKDEETTEEIVSTEELEPVKLIDSTATLVTLTNRTKELASQILSTIDKEQSLSKQLSVLNIEDINTAVSKETLYKTEEEYDIAYMNQVMNHNNNDLFKSHANFAVSTERKKRYATYQQMLDQNYISERVLEAYTENIIIRNAQTKSYINVQVQDEKKELFDSLGNDLKNSYDKLCKAFLIKYKIQKQMKDTIVPNTNTFGNYFIEILDLNKLNELGGIATHEQIIMDSSGQEMQDQNGHSYTGIAQTEIISESTIFESTFYTKKKKTKESTQEKIYTEVIFESNFDCYKSEEDLLIATQNLEFQQLMESETGSDIDNFLKDTINEGFDSFDSSLFDIQEKSESDFELDKIGELKLDALKDIYLDYHHPEKVIIIEKNNLTFGYLIIEDISGPGAGSYEVDRFKRFSAGLSSSGVSGSEHHDTQQVIRDTTESITKEILKKVTHNIRLNKKRSLGTNFDYFKTLDIGEDAISSLKLLIYHKIKQKSKLKFRFLTPDSIINFSGSIQNKFAPYGTSVLDKMVQPVKLYTLALMASIVSRLSRAAVVRKWTIEAGDKRNHDEIVAKTTADLKSKAITFDKINQMKNVAEIITDYRDMATISINQQRFIDMEILPMQDRGLPLNDMNDLKQDVIAAGGVPSVYLNITDNIDLREKLVHLNITFANTVINKQALFEDGLDQLLNNIFKKLLKYNGFKQEFILSSYISYKLNPPLVLQLQSDEAQITTVSNILNVLDGIKFPVNPKTLLQRYIPNINWEVLYKEGETYKQELAKIALMDPNNQGGY